MNSRTSLALPCWRSSYGRQTGFAGRLQRACKQLGLDHLWFHDLRRSFVTNARRRGVAESVVMRMSGHRTRNVFDRYNIVEDEDVRNAVKVIEAGAARDLQVKAG